MSYEVVPLQGSPTDESFAAKVEELINERAKKGKILKQGMQLRANHFIFIFEVVS